MNCKLLFTAVGRQRSIPLPMVSVVVVVALLVGGLYYFRRMEKTFAEVV